MWLDTLALIYHYYLSLKDIARKQTAYHINNFDAGNMKITSVSPSKNIDEKEKNKK